MLGAMMYGYAPSPKLRAEYDSRLYPAAALATLRNSDRIFTSDTWGGYLIYRRYPAKVFTDGRSDFYGPAFEKEYAERVFLIFQRLHGKSEYPGSGVGLAICKKIVDQHGGSIRADATPGKGSIFTVFLPVQHS